MCDLFVSKCSAKVYGTGKQWAVCTHYSSKHTPMHTCGNVRAHMDFTSCPAIITQTVKNKTQTRGGTCRADVSMQTLSHSGRPLRCQPPTAECVCAVSTIFHLRERNMGNTVPLVPNDGLNGHQREKVREFVWWCMLREHFSGGTVFDPHRLVNPYVSCPDKASPVKTPSQTLLRISEPNYLELSASHPPTHTHTCPVPVRSTSEWEYMQNCPENFNSYLIVPRRMKKQIVKVLLTSFKC